MLEILTFSQCLQKLMLEYQLSSTSISTLLGSRVILKRLLHDEASPSMREEACKKLLEAHLFSEADCERLHDALEVSRIGIELYQFHKAIHYVLTGDKGDIQIHPLKTDGGLMIEDRLAYLLEAEKIDILCVNCSCHALFASLTPLFENKERKIHLRHYIHADVYANTAANFVAVVYPLIFDHRYEPYGIERTSALPHYLGGNLLAIQAECHGEHTEHFFVISNDQCAYEMPHAARGEMYNFIQTLVQSVSPAPYPLKETIGQTGNFTSLYMGHLSHELNRATYSISSDLLIQQVPTEIGLAALRDKQALHPDELDKLIRLTAPIHEQRYQNQYCKKKPSYHIMTKLGCRSFLRTGMNTDHFFGFRAYTPKERKCIFGEMLRQGKENPYFIPLLFKREDYENHFTLVCCDKLGVSVDSSTTDYSWDQENHSVFITYPEFTRQYLDFYLHSLIPEKCHTEEDSLAILRQMYEEFLIEFNLTDD